MTFYVGFEVLLLFFALAIWVTRGNRIVIISLRWALGFILIFKFQTGTDWPLYVSIHNSLYAGAGVPVDRFLEPGYLVIAQLMAWFSDNPQLILWMGSGTVLFALYKLEVGLPRRWIGLFYVVSINFLIFPVFFGVLRQAIALALCLLALAAWQMHKRKRVILFLALAPLFQISSVMYGGIALLSFFPLYGQKALPLYALIAGAARAALLLATALSLTDYTGRLSIYLARDASPLGAETVFILVLASVIALTLGYRHFSKLSDDPVATGFSRVAVITALLTIAFIDVEVIRNRLIYLLIPATAVAIMRDRHRFQQLRTVALAGLAAMSVVYYAAWLHREIGVVYLPYKNYWVELATTRDLPYKAETSRSQVALHEMLKNRSKDL